MRIIVAVLALAIAALAPVANAQTTPSAYKSLQPFERFAKGAGEGVAYAYKARTKAQFVALLRDKQLAKKEMRVSCDVLVRQMAEGHQALPFEGCEGAAAAIENNNDFAVVACRDEMFQRENLLTVTNDDASAWGTWHRKCLQNEQVLVYKNRPLISLTCLNVAIPVVPQQAPPRASAPAKPAVPTFATGACPKGIVLFSNAWVEESIRAASEDLWRRANALVTLATERDSKNASDAKAYKPDAFSRTLGDEIIDVVRVRAPVGVDIHARLLDPMTLQVVEDLGKAPLIDGIAKIYLTDNQRANIVETVWPAWFSSPTVSGGERRLWFFPHEWEKKTESGRFCTKQQHGFYKKVNRP